MTGKFNSRRFLKCSVAIGFSVAVWGQQDMASAQPAALEKPPALNYKQICKGPEQPLPLALDWASWNGGDTDVAPERMLQDAVQLIDGGNVVHRDRPLARRLLEQLAAGQSAVSPEAKRRLAILLLDPRAGDSDPERAKHLLSEATAAQRTDAALTLGRLIHDGKLPGFSKDDAARYFGVAVGLGDPVAALELAALYRTSELVAPFEGAAAHFETLGAINVLTTIASGNCAIALDVGDYLSEREDGLAVANAISWYEIAAGAGDMRAMGKLARAYDLGLGVKADPAEALKLWDRAAAAGSVSAMAPAARPRLVEGTENDKAMALLKSGMANDDPDSFLLAARDARGDYSGKADFQAMGAILASASEKSDASIYTLDMAGQSYLTGQGVSPSLDKAEQLYQRILATGLPEAEALYGRYKVKNALGLDDGARHLKHAVEGGSDTAKFVLADLAACVPQDGIDAGLLMQQAAEAGSTAAMRSLARQLLQAADAQRAIPYLERASKGGDRLAMVELAALALATEGAESKRARALMEQAAAAGDGVTSGRLALALAYATGRLGDDEGKSDELLASIDESGDPDVDVEIARRKLEGGSLGPADLDDVSVRLHRAAMSGESSAMLLLSRFMTSSMGDNAGAAEWLERAAARGEPTALAEIPTDGAIVSRVLAGLENVPACDLPLLMQKARLLRLSGQAAAAEDVLSLAEKRIERQPRDLFQMAQGLLSMAPPVPSDLGRAEKLLLKSAETGYAKAGLAVAKLYDSGRLGKRAADAIDWYRKVALAGEISPLRELSRHASLAASSKDEELALNALKQVAEADNPAAMRTYGTLLTNQRSGRYAEGMTFLQKAADMGDATAMKTLAWHYAAGLNGEVSAKESIHWMRMAAEKGDAEAMFRYATALDLGFGVSADPQSAKSWHERAIKNGFVQ